MSLKNQRVVIIGGSSGIGLAVAKRALQENAQVIIASRSLEKLQRAKQQLGANLIIKQVDIRDENGLRMLYTDIGKFDHLQMPGNEVQSAAFANQAIDNVKKSFESKFWGQYQAAKLALPYLNQTGSITFYSGTVGRRPQPGLVIQAAINSAIEGLSRALALELAPLRVNTISPGLTDTPLFNYLTEAERKELFTNFTANLPIKRAATADEIAQAAIYIMNNHYVTGSILSIDGGHSLY